MSRLPNNDRALPADIRDCRTAGISTLSLPGPVTPWPPSVTYLNCSATLLSHTSTTTEQHSTEMCLRLCFWYSPPLVPHLTPWHWLDQHTAGGHLTAVLIFDRMSDIKCTANSDQTWQQWKFDKEAVVHLPRGLIALPLSPEHKWWFVNVSVNFQQSGQHEKYCWTWMGLICLTNILKQGAEQVCRVCVASPERI